MDWLLQPVVLLGLLTAGLGLGVWFFVSVKLELARQNHATRQQVGEIEKRMSELEARLEARKPEPAPRPVMEVPAMPESYEAAAMPSAGLNLTRRSQALRMHRRGESPEKIAAALNLPANEVDLLLKVQSILTENLN